MNAKNKYIKHAKISEGKFRLFIRYFVEDLSATQISNLLGISRNSVNRYILMLRKLIYTYSLINPHYTRQDNQSIFIDDANCNSNHDCNLYLGILIIKNMIYTEVTYSNNFDIDQRFINNDVVVEGVNLSYDMIIDFKKEKFKTINHTKGNNLDLIRGFLSFVKSRLAKFNGLDKRYFDLHLKECEFRFNNRDIDMYKLLLKLIRQNPL